MRTGSSRGIRTPGKLALRAVSPYTAIYAVGEQCQPLQFGCAPIAPVETDEPRPFENIEAAVTRDRGEGVFNPGERLDILDAIDAYTINGARLLGQQAETGSLEVGKKADFVLLDCDIIALARDGHASTIRQTEVIQTWFDGRLVYQREAQ